MVHIASSAGVQAKTACVDARDQRDRRRARKTPRSPTCTSGERINREKPHSYIRVRAEFIVSQVLGSIKDRIMRPGEASGHTIQIPPANVQSLARPRPDHSDVNVHLRSDVKQAMAMRHVSIEPNQIQILTHRTTGEKWVRIIDVDRSRRTTLRLAIKRAGISTSLEFKDEVEGSDWSIRFTAAEASKLVPQSPDSFDVHIDHQTFAGNPGKNVEHASNVGTSRMGRNGSHTATADSPSPKGIPSRPRMVS